VRYLINFTALVISIPSAALTYPLENGIFIPENPHRSELIQYIPLKKNDSKKLAQVKIRESSGQCNLIIGNLPKIKLEMAAPCDLQTLGSMYAFRPRIEFKENLGTPDEISFEIVGNLKYYPSIRSECSKISRVITIQWKKKQEGHINALHYTFTHFR